MSLHSLKTSHISPWRVSCGVPIVRIWEKIDHVIMTPHCIKVIILTVLLQLDVLKTVTMTSMVRQSIWWHSVSKHINAVNSGINGQHISYLWQWLHAHHPIGPPDLFIWGFKLLSHPYKTPFQIKIAIESSVTNCTLCNMDPVNVVSRGYTAMMRI